MDRTEIFNQLTLDELRETDLNKAESLMGNNFPKFARFCEYLQSEADRYEGIVSRVSCDIGEDSSVTFHAELADGSVSDIVFDDDPVTVTETTATIKFGEDVLNEAKLQKEAKLNSYIY